MSNELDEKVVAGTGGDGVKPAETPEPVTGAGGAIPKKKADVKKAADPKADKVDGTTPGQGGAVKEEAEIEEEVVIEHEASIAAMFEGMDLAEDFKSKVTLVFEAAVNEAAAIKAAAIVEQKTAELEAEMNESVQKSVDQIVENLDSYLDYVVEEWMKENELAIETGVKVEMAESLMDGLKSLFEEHNIEVNDETVDVVAGLEEQAKELKDAANEAINEAVALKAEIASLKAERVFEEMTEDLTITQRERLKVLSEKLDADNIDEYKSDLATLKESFFAKPKAVVEGTDDVEEEIITEETKVKAPVSDYSSINALVNALNSRSAKH